MKKIKKGTTTTIHLFGSYYPDCTWIAEGKIEVGDLVCRNKRGKLVRWTQKSKFPAIGFIESMEV